MLKLAGVDVNIFKGHSTRVDSTSKATVSGLSSCEILERGSWSSASTWQRFYKKDIIRTTLAIFQNSILKKENTEEEDLGSSKMEHGS